MTLLSKIDDGPTTPFVWFLSEQGAGTKLLQLVRAKSLNLETANSNVEKNRQVLLLGVASLL